MIALLLMGCSSWIDQQPACEYDVYDWSDDLLAHVMTGDGSGEFDYDPEDVPRNGVKGSYDPDSGDFSWKTTYAGEYWIQTASTEGFGTLFHNGNLDLLFRTVYTDVLGATWAENTRVQRNACDMTVATYADDGEDAAFVEDGEYPDDSSWAWTLNDSGYEYRGGLRKNLSRTLTVEEPDSGLYSFVNEKPEGVAEGEWETWYDLGNDTYWAEATTLRRFDGGNEQQITFYDAPGGSVVSTYSDDFEYGNANGTWTWDGVTCSQVTQGDSCTIACDDGSSGSC